MEVKEVRLTDGLYQVVHPNFVAGFWVRGGRVRRIDYAPILWRRLNYWSHSAVPVREVDHAR